MTRFGVSAVIVVAVATLVGGWGADTARAHGGETPVAHIHAGKCGALGAVAAELGPADGMTMGGMGGMAATPMAGMDEPASVLAAAPDGEVVVTVTVIPAAVANLVGGDYAINVHAGMEAITDYLACGNLADAVMAGGMAVVPLRELNGSGWSGFAILRPTPDGAATEVDLSLGHDLVGTPSSPG